MLVLQIPFVFQEPAAMIVCIDISRELIGLQPKHVGIALLLEPKHVAISITLEAKHVAISITLEARHVAISITLEAKHVAISIILEAKHVGIALFLKTKHVGNQEHIRDMAGMYTCTQMPNATHVSSTKEWILKL